MVFGFGSRMRRPRGMAPAGPAPVRAGAGRRFSRRVPGMLAAQRSVVIGSTLAERCLIVFNGGASFAVAAHTDDPAWPVFDKDLRARFQAFPEKPR